MPRMPSSALLAATAVLALVATDASTAAQVPRAPAAESTDELPGVDVSGLTAPQLSVLKKVVAEEFCYCGCPHTLDGCLKGHHGCHHAPRMAQLAARYAAQSLSASDIRKILREYYAGFDRKKRAKLDVKDYGPPLGEESAPVVIVEFSDFTCPFCQRIQPGLDRFVRDEADRVRLYYKPFPIASHEHAMDAAIAAEWARDRGLFWKMYDELFAHARNLSESDLAGYAAAIGGDPDDLRKALESGRNKARITASQAEARAANIVGTPTLFLNGHRLDLPYRDDLREVLDFAVDDEQEWVRNDGWKRD